MIARIVIGSGADRLVVPLPCLTNRKDHNEARRPFAVKLKQTLWPNGRGFRAAKARGEAARASA